MSTLITTTPVTATYQSYQLGTYTDMINALSYINTHGGYFGSVTLTPNAVWQLIIQSNNPNQAMTQTALIGDYVVIKNGNIVSVVAQANYASQFSP